VSIEPKILIDITVNGNVFRGLRGEIKRTLIVDGWVVVVT